MRTRALALFLASGFAFAGSAPRVTFGFTGSNTNPGAIAVDPQGYSYLAASTTGNPIAATPGSYQPQNNGGTCWGGGPGALGPGVPIPCRNVVVTKLDPTGNVVFTTYLGGAANVDAVAIAYGSDGSVYVAGTVSESSPSQTSSFPFTPGAAFPGFDTETGEGTFLARLNASGSQLIYSTYLPGVQGVSLAVDAAGEAVFLGGWAPDVGVFPATVGAYQSAPLGSYASVVVGKLSADGSTLLWGTYLSAASGFTSGGGIGLDSSGDVLIGGVASSMDFPSTSGQFSTAYNTPNGYLNLFLAKFSADGSRLLAANLLGPASGSMTMGPAGDIYFLAYALSLPVSSMPFGLNGGTGEYLLRISADGSSIADSIELPFTVSAMGVDTAGNVYLIGSGSVTATPGSYLAQPSGPQSTVIAKTSPTGDVAGATYFDQPASEIAVEQDGSVMVAGAYLGAFFAANLFPAITVENAASFVANFAVPGELVAIRGYGLGPEQGLVAPPSTSLGGVQVSFDSFVAPVIYVQSGQINAQVPWEISGQTSTQVSIVYNGSNTGSASLPVVQSLPGVLYIENADGSLNSSTNPAHAGDTIAIYGTGGGVLNPPGTTGRNWPLSPLSQLAQSVSVSLNGQPASAIPYAGSAPALDSGVCQINATLPAAPGQGSGSLILTIGGVSSPPAALWVQ